MPVPRRWWENALESGNVDKNNASVLHGWQEEFSSILDSDEDYLAKAEGVLEKRPESAVLGRQILNKCLD